jgi:hypothetical protein
MLNVRCFISHMKTLILRSFMTLVLAANSAFAYSPQQQSAKSFAARFYRTYLKLKIRGLPDSKEYRVLSPFLSQDLRRLFEAAARKKERFIKENASDLKPPWADGDLFTSLWEGAQSFQLGSPRIRGKYAEVAVHLVYGAGKSVTRWSDNIVLVRTKDGWRVWDILLKGNWPFKSGDSLRSILKADIETRV